MELLNMEKDVCIRHRLKGLESRGLDHLGGIEKKFVKKTYTQFYITGASQHI